MNRITTERVFLVVKNVQTGKWEFPSCPRNPSTPMYQVNNYTFNQDKILTCNNQASHRVLKEIAGEDAEIWTTGLVVL